MFGSILGAGTAILGGILGSKSKNKATAAQKDVAMQELEYQKELHKNQIQWRVEDAKKAGLHPLAALGLSSASYSPVSSSIDSSGTDYSWIGDVGQNLNRSIMAGKTEKERKQALDRQAEIDNVNLRKAYAEADLAETTAATERFRLQRELFPPSPVANAATDPQIPKPPKPQDLFTFVLDGKGKKTRLYPTEFMTSTWEDRPGGSSLIPLLEAEKLEQDAKLNGTVVVGHIWSPSRGEFVPVNSRDGKLASAYWKRVGSVPRSQRALIKYPRERMNSLDSKFFDWIDRIFN